MACNGASAFIIFALIEIHKRTKIKRKKFCSKMPSELFSKQKEQS